MNPQAARPAWGLAVTAALAMAAGQVPGGPATIAAAIATDGAAMAATQAPSRPAPDQPPAAATPLRLAAPDRGRALTLPAGTVLRVDLDANYSTGAEWQRRDAFGDVLASVPCEGIERAPLVTPGEPAPPVGTGTTASYCFRTAAPGRAYLYLFYGRAWTPEAPAWDHFTLDVTVTPAG